MDRRISHVIGFDDAPFTPAYRGDVLVVGAVFCCLRLEGVLSGKVRRDGANASRALAELVAQSRFAAQAQAVLLQGIALAGFNVIDPMELQQRLRLPLIAVARRRPDMAAIRHALLERVPGGRRKWERLQRWGPLEAAAGVYVQRIGILLPAAEELIQRLAVNSALPEPLRTAHLIAGGVTLGESRHRA